MGYDIQCDACKNPSWASNIVELIDDHLDENHMIMCTNCGASGAYIYKISETQEGPGWERWIKGIIRIDYNEEEVENYHPYVFLITHKGAQGKIDSLQISYYKDLRKSGGELKHGHGPGGTPVLDLQDIKNISRKMIEMGVISP